MKKQEFQHNTFNQENSIFIPIHNTIVIMHRRLGHFGRDRARYMINERLTSLPYSDMLNFYTNHICKTCALENTHKKLHNKCHPKCCAEGGRWYADLTEITGERFNSNYYIWVS